MLMAYADKAHSKSSALIAPDPQRFGGHLSSFGGLPKYVWMLWCWKCWSALAYQSAFGHSDVAKYVHPAKVRLDGLICWSVTKCIHPFSKLPKCFWPRFDYFGQYFEGSDFSCILSVLQHLPHTFWHARCTRSRHDKHSAMRASGRVQTSANYKENQCLLWPELLVHRVDWPKGSSRPPLRCSAL